MYEFKIICDDRENFDTKTDFGFFNDHQDRDTFEKICQEILNLGYNSEIWGGVSKLGHAYVLGNKFNENSIFINLSDGLNTQYSRVQVPVFCDLLGVKYSGSGPFEVALATNKYYSNIAVKQLGYNVPKDILFNRKYIRDQEIIVDKYPVIVKPNCEGSSLGISNKSVCYNKRQIHNYIRDNSNLFPELLIEEYIPGYDVTDFVIGNNDDIMLNEALIIRHHDKIMFNFEVLGVSDHINKSRTFLLADEYLPSNLVNEIKNESKSIMNGLHINDICRIDYRVTEKGEVFFLEINTVPAIHKDSQAGAICQYKQFSFGKFIDLFLQTVLKRFNHE